MAEKMTLEKAKELIAQGYHCPQVVLWHTAEALGMDKDLALKVSGGMGGGSFAGGTCGAISGGVMSLDLVYGFSDVPTPEQNALMMEKVQELDKRFMEKHGTILCRELLGGWNSILPGHLQKIAETGAANNCPQICVDVCEILDDMLADQLK